MQKYVDQFCEYKNHYLYDILELIYIPVNQ